MERDFPNLCKPIKIGNVTFKNRMFSAPMGGTDISPTGCIGPGSKGFYEYRAKGGAGAVTVSECMVHPETDASHGFHLDLTIPGSLSSFTLTADAINRHGAIASVELSHSGQFAGTYLTDKKRQKNMVQFGVSPGVRDDGFKIEPLNKDQIDSIINSFGTAASLAKRAGFRMVMVHGGHGWLINQFLSPIFNKRTDEYGGSLENRVRFAKEVLLSIRQAVGKDFPIEFRMSGAELCAGGYSIEDGIEIAKKLNNFVDLFHVSAGTYQKTFDITHPSMFKEHGCNVYLAEKIKKNVTKPVATIGGLNNPYQMEEIISSRKADIVVMGRALLADPYLPTKVVLNKPDRIVKCLRCFACMSERAETGTRRCAINPFIGREIEGLEVLPTSNIRNVVVVGGGPGGLQAAITAAKRGHKVVLFEKETEVGGILKSEQAIPFKNEMYELGLTLEKLAVDEGVKIIKSTVATYENVIKELPYALIIAAGSEPIIPPIKGIDGENVIVVNNYYKQKNNVKDSVVVLGGGLAGCEAAIHLGQEGKKVSIVEMRDELAPDANIRHRPLLLNQLEKYTTIYTSYKGVEITLDGLTCVDKKNKTVKINGKSLIVAVGQKSSEKITEELRNAAPLMFEIGDCVKPGTIKEAVYMGHHAAMDI